MDALINLSTIALVICAYSSVARAGLVALATSSEEISSARSLQIVGRTNSLRSLTHWLQTQTADLAIVDLSSAEESDINELAQIVETLPPEESLSLLLMIDSSLENNEYFVQLLQTQLLSTGLVSLLPMTVSAQQMGGAIASITQGLTIIHPEIAEALFDPATYRLAAIEPRLENASDSRLEPLTARELEVLNQLANGITNKEIALALAISEHTAKFHISAILSKLNVASRTEAVTVGIRAGLVAL